MINRYWQGLPILAGKAIRYWQRSRSDTGRVSRYWQGRRFDTGRIPTPILAGIAALLLLSVSCAAPGWAADHQTAPEPSPAALSSPVPTRETQETGKPSSVDPGSSGELRETVSAIRALNVRERASEKSPGLGVLYHGDSVSLTRRCSPGWVEIFYKGSRAWVNARYITGDLCEEE